MKQRLTIWLVPHLIKIAIAGLSATIRWEFTGKRYRPDSSEQHIFTFWHARLLMMGVGLKGCKGYTLISEHKDGGLIADTLHLQGFRAIRGSSTRGGSRALVQMIRRSRNEECDFGITPDGPKGPREIIKPGIVLLAKKTGIKIHPVMWATKHHWRITGSWDHFYVPKPCTKGIFVFGEPLLIDADADETESLIRIQSAMDATQKEADCYFK
ncbi:MAG: lysophospholipid acyltransferase family protein [Mariprofundaceae bacterium]|nr:lysophospholipid acyltransferase family protein [Mariprofundaceae bacterium]